jgi:hypothetical protein
MSVTIGTGYASLVIHNPQATPEPSGPASLELTHVRSYFIDGTYSNVFRVYNAGEGWFYRSVEVTLYNGDNKIFRSEADFFDNPLPPRGEMLLQANTRKKITGHMILVKE